MLEWNVRVSKAQLMLALLGLSLALFFPCQPFAAAGPTQSLLERARELWGARVSEDWARAYRLLSLEEQADMGESQFVALRTKRGPFEYLEARVERAAVEGAIGWVKVNYRVRPKEYPAVPAQEVTNWRVWQRVDGVWHPVPQAKLHNFPQLPPQERPAEEEARLARHSHAFWEAKETQHWDAVLQYMEPNVREEITKQESVEREALYKYLGHELKWVEVIGDQGRVKVHFTYILNDSTLRKLHPQQKAVVEHWVKIDDRWYRRI